MNRYSSLLIRESPVIFMCTLLLIIYSIYNKKPRYIVLSVLLLLLLFYFYRCPELKRNTHIHNTHNLYSPAYGRIIGINRQGIQIFLSPFDVHIQYMPIDGQIIKYVYHKGSFHPAYSFVKSRYNERMHTIINIDATKNQTNTTNTTNITSTVEIIQIAGMLVRSIATFNRINDKLQSGQSFGMIKFGSRVDMYFNSTEFKVNSNLKVGDYITPEIIVATRLEI